MRKLNSLMLAFAFFAPLAVVTAQAVASASAQGSMSGITLNVTNAPTRQVLEDIARQAGLKLIYKRGTLSEKTVSTAKLEHASVDVALRAVMKGTGATAKIGPDGETILVASVTPGADKASGIITGKIVDSKTGRGIAGVNISINSDNRGVVSDENGSYRLTGVVNGIYMLTARLVGYAKQVRSVAVNDGATVNVDFRLEPSANVLDQVVVTGSVVATELKAVPNAITVITAKQIEERGITRIDQLFRGEVPGMFAAELGSAYPAGVATQPALNEVLMFSRGATDMNTNTTDATRITTTIKTYIDGVEMANSQYLSQIDPKSIERIEILTGPQASTIYGANAINGVMQIFTKRGSGSKPSISLNMSEGFAQNNFSSSLATAHQIDGAMSGVEGRLTYNLGSGWDYTGAWTPGQQSQRTGIHGGVRYQLNAFSLDLSGRQGWTENKQRGDPTQPVTELAEQGRYRPRSAGVVIPRDASLSGRTFGVNVGYNPFPWWSHQLNLGSDISEKDYLALASGFTSIDDTSLTFNGRSVAGRTSQTYSSTLRISFASTLQATLTYGGDHWNGHSLAASWDKNPAGSIFSSSISHPRATKNTGAYVQGQLGIWDELFLTYGLRTDWNPNFGDKAKVRPGRYGVSYSRGFGSVSAKLRGSYGRSIRPPEFAERNGLELTPATFTGPAQLALFATPGMAFYSILPNPDLGPEFQQGGEGGIELYVGNRGSIVITRYNQTVDGLIYLIGPVDSVRAHQSGFSPTSGYSGCDDITDLRSDGYCYRTQSQNINAGSIRNQGWEFQGGINIGPFSTRGTYSWTKSRVLGITEKYRQSLTNEVFLPGQTFNYIPEHTWGMSCSYARGGTSISFNVNGIGESVRPGANTMLALQTASDTRLRAQDVYRMGSISSLRLSVEGYTTSHMNASHRFSSNLDMTFQISNLTNHYQNDFIAFYPTVGRTSRIGVRWRWQ